MFVIKRQEMNGLSKKGIQGFSTFLRGCNPAA